MKRNSIITGLVFVALTAGSLSAYAAGGPGGNRDGARGDGPQRPSFSELDANADGSITQEEFDGLAAQRFATLDADGNGTVTVEELIAGREAQRAERLQNMGERMLANLDANKDGVLSLEEMRPEDRSSRFFEHFDANDDGAVTAEEMADARGGPGDRGERGPRGGRFGGGHGTN